jgi:acetyltransferase-like isoleucine patch superfamily enzyme
MRNISAKPQIIFFSILTFTIIFAYTITNFTESIWAGIFAFFFVCVVIHNLLSKMYPARAEGYTEQDNLLAYDVQSLYHILFFEMILHTDLLPYPLEKLLDGLVGMKLGENSYPGSSILSTPYHFIEAGDNVIFGGGAIISPHSYESGAKLLLKPIKIGNNVTIGMNSVIMPGVVIEDDAIVAASAVVTKNTHIGRGEVWAGIPARKIRG